MGEADNFYLNDAVYEAEKFLKATTNPPFGGEVDYRARLRHDELALLNWDAGPIFPRR